MRRMDSSHSSSSRLGLSVSPTCRHSPALRSSDVTQSRCSTGFGLHSTPSSPSRTPVPGALRGFTQPQGKPVAARIRERLSQKKAKVTPELAAEVVQTYLLPLFEADVRQSNDRVRGGLAGIKALSPHPAASTLHSELRLSACLLSDLQAAKEEAQTLRRELADARAAQASAEAEVHRHQQDFQRSQTRVQMMTQVQTEMTRSYQMNILATSFISNQLRQLQKSYTAEEERCKCSLNSSHKLRNQTAELEYSNSLLRMENDIMGERLKGLYMSMSHLAGSKFTEEFLGAEYSQMAEGMIRLVREMDHVYEELREALRLRDEFRGDNMEFSAIHRELQSEKLKLARMSRDRILLLQTNLQSAEEERDKLKAELQKQEKLFLDLTEEFSKLRTKMRQYRQRRKAFGEAEEKVCRKCQRVFLENENYNWSCRTHQSEFSGDIWWCCGKEGREARGCKISKHESKEEDDEEEHVAKKEEEELRHAMQKCPVSTTQSCKQYGHAPHECPKDPNYRSHFDLGEEASRLIKLSGNKQKHALPSPEFSTYALSILATHSDQKDFNDRNAASSRGSEDDEEERSAFREVTDMKAGVLRRLPTHLVHQYSTRDFENEMKVSRRTKSWRVLDDSASAPVSPAAYFHR